MPIANDSGISVVFPSSQLIGKLAAAWKHHSKKTIDPKKVEEELMLAVTNTVTALAGESPVVVLCQKGSADHRFATKLSKTLKLGNSRYEDEIINLSAIELRQLIIATGRPMSANGKKHELVHTDEGALLLRPIQTAQAAQTA